MEVDPNTMFATLFAVIHNECEEHWNSIFVSAISNVLAKLTPSKSVQ